MNNHDLRAILIKVQDQLSDDDRKRFCSFFSQDDSSLDGSLRLIDSLTAPDKINKQNITDLIEILEKIQCVEAVKLLKEYINQTQSIIPIIIIEDDEKCAMQNLLIDQKNCYNHNNMLINSNNTNINSITVVFDNQSKFPFQSKKRQLLNTSSIIQKCFLLLIILSIILAGLVIISFIQFTRLKINYDYIVDEQIKNQEMVQRLENLQSDVNQTFQQLANKVERFNKEQKFTEGNTCGCSEWCRNRNISYGVCGDGHTCICRMQPITKDIIGNKCTCDSWCQKQGHQNGGICGDGYTCICSK